MRSDRQPVFSHAETIGGLPQPAVTGFACEVIGSLSRWSVDRSRRAAPVSAKNPSTGDFCAALLSRNLGAAQGLIDDALAAGATHEDLCLHPLGTAAMHLAERWDAGTLAYSDMALVAGRILILLRGLHRHAPRQPVADARAVLVATPPGERGALGASIGATAADALRDEGWDATVVLGARPAALSDALRDGSQAFAVLAVADHDSLPDLAGGIVALRVRTPALRIVLVGPGFGDEIDLPATLGADAAVSEIGDLLGALDRLSPQP